MTRIILATWYVFVILVTTFFTANMTANLTLVDDNFPIRNLEDLFKYDVSWATYKGGSVDLLVKRKKYINTVGDMIQRGKVKFFNPYKRLDIYKYYLQNNYVILDEVPILWSYLYKNYKENQVMGYTDVDSCDVVVSPRHFMENPRAFAYPANTTLNKLFDKVISKLHNTGILHALKRRYLVRPNVCRNVKFITNQTINSNSLTNIYGVFGTGVLLAFIVFILEIIFKIKSKQTLDIENNKIRKRNHVPNHLLSLHDTEVTEISENTVSDQAVRFKRRVVNGRQYLVGKNRDGETRLIPINTLSGLLYNLDLYEAI
ncbi:uncharacterized protein [Epargyreus clarus]